MADDVVRAWAATGARLGHARSFTVHVLDGRPVLHVAAWKRHLGLYPAPEGDADLDAALAPYRSGASTIKIPWADGVPPELVARVAAHRASRL